MIYTPQAGESGNPVGATPKHYSAIFTYIERWQVIEANGPTHIRRCEAKPFASILPGAGRGSDGEPFAAFPAPTVQDLTAADGLHSTAEAMFIFTFTITGLKGSFHFHSILSQQKYNRQPLRINFFFRSLSTIRPAQQLRPAPKSQPTGEFINALETRTGVFDEPGERPRFAGDWRSFEKK